MIEGVEDIKEADVVLVDACIAGRNSVLELVENCEKRTLIAIVNAMYCIHRDPQLIKLLIDRGFLRSWLPLDGGIALFIERGFDDVFLKKSVEVYRDSFIHGPNPIHYNTAYTLYALAKFIASHRKGTILEIGTGKGFSTLWLAYIAKEFDISIASLDNRCDRVEYALSKMRELGLGKYVEIMCRDAKGYSHGRQDIVFVFIDGKKDEYHLYLEAVEQSLVKGALIVARNTLSSAHEMEHYIEKVYRYPYRSITIATDPARIMVSIYHP